MKHANISLFIPLGGCPQTCSFCNQHTIASVLKQPTAGEVSEQLCRAVSALDTERFTAEIAFFGGSFTALDREYMCALLGAAQPYLSAKGVTGIRISTRPDAIDGDVLRILSDFGVTAIELGAQSMDNTVLARNRRGHTAEQVAEASKRIRDAGFSLGLQMMTGLYGDTDEMAMETAARLIALKPDTMRIYPTIVLSGTHLAALYKAGEYRPQTLEEAVRLCAVLLDRFEMAGIRVIRLGLHDGVDLARDRVAGPYHPAFRELCESERFYRRLVCRIGEAREVSVAVHPTSMSVAVGQKKANVNRLGKQGVRVRFVPDDGVRRGEFEILQKS